LGENVTRQADLRVIAATNRDLRKLVNQGHFREDLYFRLNVIALEVPALRCRVGDLERFASHYLKHFASQCGRNVRFNPEALTRIRSYPWPGNLRELRNAIERAVILAKADGEIGSEDMPVEGRVGADDHGITPQPGEMVTLERLEEAHIKKILDRTGSVAEAARVLGVDQATVYRKRKKMGLEPVHELQVA
jgi:NtrC-family two-component system response regulator AlgB